MFHIKLVNKEDELNDFHKNLFKGNCRDKGVNVNRLAFLGSALEAVVHGNNESEAKIQIFSKRGTNVRIQENEKRRNCNRNKEMNEKC